jgi:hypothetical protein
MVSSAAINDEDNNSRNKLPAILLSNPSASILQSSNLSTAMQTKTPISNGSSKIRFLSTKNGSQDAHDEDFSPGHALEKTANFDDALDNL